MNKIVVGTTGTCPTTVSCLSHYCIRGGLSSFCKVMDRKKLLEEKLREAACLGDLKTLEDCLSAGVDINSKNSMNGWTALHWGACRGNIEIVNILLRNGADRKSLTHKNETPYDVSSADEVQILLEGKINKKEQQLPVIPNYLRNPPFWYSNRKGTG